MIYSHYSQYMAESMSAGRPGPEPDEYEFLHTYLERCEQPFLELACGYGRLLLHIQQQGYRIVGTDSSPQMLAKCRELAQHRGLAAPETHEQFMQRLALDGTFGFVFIADCTFSLVVEDGDAQELFRRVFEHLTPGGIFLFDFYPIRPKTDAEKSVEWTGWQEGSDGALYVSRKICKYDDQTHRSACLQIHDRYVDGQFVGSQAYEDPGRDYHPDVLKEWLLQQGFVDVRFGGCHSDKPAEDNAESLSLRCLKPK